MVAAANFFGVIPKPDAPTTTASLGRDTAVVKVGDRAPVFRLQSTRGDYLGLEDFLGKKNLVIYFYPKDHSFVCTREACSFRDSYHIIQAFDAEILGISSDGINSHKKFSQDEWLPFPLLSDQDGAARRAYRVKPSFGIISSRTTFVIDKHGIVRYVYTSQIHPERHVKEAIKALESFSK